VVGVDLAASALDIARAHDSTSTVTYAVGDAKSLPLYGEKFDVVCAMDVLEHVTPWQSVVAECARVLKPGGIFFFYTFNRTFLAWLLAVKGVEWVVRNTPPHLHAYEMFIKPQELEDYSSRHGLQTRELCGLMPKVSSKAFWQLLLSGEVSPDFEFRITRSTRLSYLGYAVKEISLKGDRNGYLQ